MTTSETSDDDTAITELTLKQSDDALRQLRQQYDETLKRQNELEQQLLEIRHHTSPVSNQTRSTQCRTTATIHAYCQTDTQVDNAGDDRFYNKVDEIVTQNRNLHQNIVDLRQELHALDATRKTMRSDFNAKFSEAVERAHIIGDKREKSYMGRIQKLEEERTSALVAPDKMEIGVGERAEEIINQIKSLTAANAPQQTRLQYERDNALKRCVKLDNQVTALKSTKETLTGQVGKLEEEVQSLRLFYNLHQSLSQEASLRDQYDTQVTELTERLKQRETEVLAMKHENDALAEMVRRLEKQLSFHIPNGHHHRQKQSSSSTSLGTR
eukprot:sb/3466749/